MVDFESFFDYGPAVPKVGSLLPYDAPECGCLQCQTPKGLEYIYRTRFDRDQCQRQWEDEQFMLCPPRVLGYILRDKKWAQLQISCLKDIPRKGSGRSWNRVKLADGEDTKTTILNLVNGHKIVELGDGDSDLMVDDIVAKKGKGLVILLYGQC